MGKNFWWSTLNPGELEPLLINTLATFDQPTNGMDGVDKYRVMLANIELVHLSIGLQEPLLQIRLSYFKWLLIDVWLLIDH